LREWRRRKMGDIYYKVVVKTSGQNLESCCPPKGAKVKYPKKKWAYPVKGTVGLLVFNDLRKARVWQGGQGREVWECEIKGPAKEVKYLGSVSKQIEVFTWPDDPAELRAGIMRRAALWEDGGFWITAPDGTLAVQGVKLLRKVA
jgi:hypothetical protein